MRHARVLSSFVTEAERLCAALRTLDEADWELPTGCEPWTVRELLGHVGVTIGWLPSMLSAPAPERATVSATGYYRPDPRFSPQTNSRRIELARAYSVEAGPSGKDVLHRFEEEWRNAAELCAQEPQDRVVSTRHGDPMLLADFLATRVVEVAVHGLDLAAAVRSTPWLTGQAAELLTELLVGEGGADRLRRLAWEPAVFLAKAAGRTPMSEAEREDLERLGIRWLTLG